MVENDFIESYFGFVDCVESYRDKIFIRFDIFLQKYLSILQFSYIIIDSIIPEIPTKLLEIDLTKNDLYKFNGLKGRIIEEGRWYIVKLRKEKPGKKAYTFDDPIDDVGHLVFISDIIYLDRRQLKTKTLEKIISLDSIPDAEPDKIKRTVNRPVGLPKVIACYNVGQGNCNASCNDLGIPLLYFDFGGGINRNAKTYPRQKHFCLLARPAIILSHWDIDHWSSGLRCTDSHNCKWIAPRQSIGLTHKKFAAKLHAKGNLLIWPDKIKSIMTKFGNIIRLPRNRNRNLSGVIMLANTNNIDDNGKRFKANTLLPGDSPYRIIPNIRKLSFHGLVATHHGGNYRGDIPPLPNATHTIAYSYGNGNSYGHPSNESLNRHFAIGWNYRLDTPNGNIALGIGRRNVRWIPCLSLCDLHLVQS